MTKYFIAVTVMSCGSVQTQNICDTVEPLRRGLLSFYFQHCILLKWFKCVWVVNSKGLRFTSGLESNQNKTRELSVKAPQGAVGSADCGLPFVVVERTEFTVRDQSWAVFKATDEERVQNTETNTDRREQVSAFVNKTQKHTWSWTYQYLKFLSFKHLWPQNAL